MKSKEQTLWSNAEDKSISVDDEFMDDIVKRVQTSVTVSDYLFMFLQGFFNICMGLLRGLPKRDPSKIHQEKREL